MGGHEHEHLNKEKKRVPALKQQHPKQRKAEQKQASLISQPTSAASSHRGMNNKDPHLSPKAPFPPNPPGAKDNTNPCNNSQNQISHHSIWHQQRSSGIAVLLLPWLAHPPMLHE